MKKLISTLSLALVLALGLSVAAPATAYAAGDEITPKELTAYLYSKDKTATLTCLFTQDLPNMAYISTADFCKYVFLGDTTETKNDDGTYTVTNSGGSMVVDPEKDALHFDLFEDFLAAEPDAEGSLLDSPYCQYVETVVEGEPRSLDLDLTPYGIDLLAYEGRTYFPASTLSLLCAMTYNTAVYADGSIYFVHTSDLVSGESYFDRSGLYETTARSRDVADLTYRELCLAVDKIYGRPAKAEISPVLEKTAFDDLLESYSAETGRAKELLLSDSKVDFVFGLAYLTALFDDGGHTAFEFPLLELITSYSDSALTAAINAKMEAAGEDDQDANLLRQLILDALFSGVEDGAVLDAREAGFADYETVKTWEDDAEAVLRRAGDTAIFSFDSFQNPAVYDFKESLDYARENGLRNFVIDLSCNSGGNSAVVSYMMAMMTNGDRDNNLAYERTVNTISGNTVRDVHAIDLNLDGVFDEKDKEVYYDFNYIILTSHLSFSCGNLLPCAAQDAGIPVIGETSGGGACAIAIPFTPEAFVYSLSSYNKSINQAGQDVDAGAPVIYDLTGETTDEDGNPATDYAGLYDADNYRVAPFTDLDRTGWYLDSVRWALAEGVMQGTGKTVFSPNASATRGQLVTMLWRLAGAPASDYAAAFSDVAPGAWYADAVNWAAENQIVEGYADSTFRPDGKITREQLAAVLCRCARSQGTDVSQGAGLSVYTDADKVSDWAESAVAWAVKAGVITGVGKDQLSPKTSATRVQVAAMLMRFETPAE